jgi:hypothetical protein
MVAASLLESLTTPQVLLFGLSSLAVVLCGYVWYKADQRYETKTVLEKRFSDIWLRIDRIEAEAKAAHLLAEARVKAVEIEFAAANNEVRKSIHELRQFIQGEFLKLVASVSEMKGQLNGMGHTQ